MGGRGASGRGIGGGGGSTGIGAIGGTIAVGSNGIGGSTGAICVMESGSEVVALGLGFSLSSISIVDDDEEEWYLVASLGLKVDLFSRPIY